MLDGAGGDDVVRRLFLVFRTQIGRRLDIGVASLTQRARRAARTLVREKSLSEPRDARAALGAGRAPV